ncbi:monovalent cation/H(+) antiporter subunit G [Paracandidimonas soli]|uniref:Multisubunit potassium/proton antiporter PhaG subunit n=1 Tax=Paracandidimonas soli TaxID=1917182 RepID=A0A4R3UUB3_9BURK|nr:monovalent cation/H(+) antiporter subunit G [Paracandidimonas soli]TCU94551.1 multisubunit potassium/proton antiporter PhaG subunit [Paracandidimonas soli]
MNELELPLWISIPAAILLVSSGIFALLGSFGLLRFSNFYPRMHAPTLGNTLGVTCVLFCSILLSSFLEQRPVVYSLIITLFLIITSPVTAVLLMKAALRRDARKAIENATPSEDMGKS